MPSSLPTIFVALLAGLQILAYCPAGFAADAKPEETFPPTLPDGRKVATLDSDELLRGPALRDGVAVANTPPKVEFLYYPGQIYPGKPWSNWGQGTAASGKYYSAIGDHLAIGNQPEGSPGAGTARVFEYDPETKEFRQLVDLATLLKRPQGHYTPSKIHTRLDLGRDGWLYFATHRGSTRVTTDENHYQGDWIVRCHPKTAQAEVVAHAPVAKHAIPTGHLDPERLIFYGGTTPGSDSREQAIQFFAYDVQNRKLLATASEGPGRAMILSASTGRLYYTQGDRGLSGGAALMRFDPASHKSPTKIDGEIGIRAATDETPQGIVYAVSQGDSDSVLYAFDTKTERVTKLGPAAVASQTYVASIAANPSGRYLYYMPGAHGSSDRDGSPVVQYDTSSRRAKVLAFLHPLFEKELACIPKGTYSVAVDPAGDKLYVTWNISRGGRNWDCCGLTVLHIPPGEREP